MNIFVFYNFIYYIIFGVIMAIFQRQVNDLWIITNPNLHFSIVSFGFVLFKIPHSYIQNIPLNFVLSCICFNNLFYFCIMHFYETPNILKEYFTALYFAFNKFREYISFYLIMSVVSIFSINIVSEHLSWILYQLFQFFIVI